jgi:3'(2'), 5'-bisphosphate nucleotidase
VTPARQNERDELTDAALAADLAADAGKLLLAVRDEIGFDHPWALGEAGDTEANSLILRRLRDERPDDAVLSEEAHDDLVRLRCDRVWIIDPLDGTREFSEEGRTDWAVHVALWTADSSSPSHLTAGAVAMPAQHRTIATDHPPAYPPMPLGGAENPIRIAASRTRPPEFVTALAAELGAELVPMGSAGVKIAAVINGEADAYIHAGGQYEWDSAAPVAVALATGLHASRIDGSALKYNEADPKLPDLVVCRKDLAPRLLAALQRHLPSPTPRKGRETA